MRFLVLNMKKQGEEVFVCFPHPPFGRLKGGGPFQTPLFLKMRKKKYGFWVEKGGGKLKGNRIRSLLLSGGDILVTQVPGGPFACCRFSYLKEGQKQCRRPTN